MKVQVDYAITNGRSGNFFLLTMKNRIQIIFYLSVAAAIFVGVLLAFFFIGGSGLFGDGAMSKKNFDSDINSRTKTVYVDGAVCNPGWYPCDDGETYAVVAAKAGLLSVSVIKQADLVVDNEVDCIYVCFREGEIVYDTINVNGVFFSELYGQYGIDEDVANKIIGYIAENGKLKSKKELYEKVLSDEEWVKNHYRMHVEVSE